VHPTSVHVYILRNAVENTLGILSQMISLTQHFYGRTLPSFSSAERTCIAIFFLRWPNEHVTS